MSHRSDDLDGRAGRWLRARTRLQRALGRLRKRRVAIPTIATMVPVAVVALSLAIAASNSSNAVTAPVGQGFTVTTGDLGFILKQIAIAERHTRALEGDRLAAPQPNPNPAADPTYCLAMIGTAPDQVPDPITSYGLRTTDGSCNNLTKVLDLTNQNSSAPSPTFVNHPTFGSADQPFPRLTSPVFRAADADPTGAATSYAQKTANNVVFDAQPRTISNLIADQTSTNPAAVAAAGFPVRAQAGAPSIVPCQTDSAGADLQPLTPAGCVPAHKTLFIANVTTDVGLSPPYNSLFTFFGQFFDHGVDQTVKSGGAVIVPLRTDDPLVTLGPDGVAKTGDEVPPNLAFMVLSRAQNQPGPDGVLGTADDVQNANNTDTPWVDQSQTYTSHSSHQVFLREYVDDPTTGAPVATGRLLGGLPAGATYAGSPDGTTGESTWAATKLQAAGELGLKLKDTDVANVPMLLTDPYGNFVPGPARRLPQYVTKHGLVEGDRANPVPVPADAVSFDTPFLTDIAHNADPGSVGPCSTTGNAKGCLEPDADTTPSADFARQPKGTYDDEMLNAHFACGDGRCNENIALSTIHQIFHSEHNRLAKELDQATIPSDKALFDAFHATNCAVGCATNNPSLSTTFTYGQRLFQAARFVTEMEYQHSVFEEFARKVQPAVRPFHVYSPDINPAVTAEFAHAVYRFGHSMLDDDVARTSTVGATAADPLGTKVDNSLPLLGAFLNPPSFFDNKVDPTHPVYTPEEAAGAIVMGSSDQVGNEIDEFTTDVLRNNLLGLPLDLPTLNLTRARSEGIPPLNDVRRQIHNATNDAQLAPYTSWSDFGRHLRHPSSLINFIAAYGTHPSMRDSGPDGVLGTVDDVTTVAAKRAAARAMVAPSPTDVQPADAIQFMFSTGAWASASGGVTTTGVDAVDLWIGGLAEVTNLNGGLLGSTFNYVFQTQLEKLQDGDRFYYLARLPGLNLRTQLEGNSFAELIQRNTSNTHSLKADAFATADCRFELTRLDGTAAGFNAHGPTVADDPATQCNETKLLDRTPDGTIEYQTTNTVNPPGINSQSVYNGTPGADRITGGIDNDTFWGGDGNDVIEGAGGDDVVLGGDGNDIITDSDGADVLKGGPGNDAIDAGPGNDIVLGGDGNDVLNGGANDNETFGGPGNDFIIAGQGADTVFGGGGDDWIEGGTGQDLLQGDNGAPFFDDPGEPAPGNDIFIGQPGENDYDAEGGDDLMAQNPAIDRNAGAAGFDWAFHQYDTVPADDDMMINQMLIGVPLQLVVNRDRWQETEADSGDKFPDVIRGMTNEAVVGGAGFTGCDALDQAGVDRITGLNRYITRFPTPLSAVVAKSAMKACPLTGVFPNGAQTANGVVPGVWAEGDILMGGGASDVLEGRGNDDIIDGDHTLHVAISVRTNPADPATEIGRTDLIENIATKGTFGPGTAGMTLQAAVFAGLVDPGNLVAVREIVAQDGSPVGATPATHTVGDCGPVSPTTLMVDLTTTKNCDTAVFDGPPTNYVVTQNTDGSVTVRDLTSLVKKDPLAAGLPKGDGTDTLWNIENMRFCTVTDVVSHKCLAYLDRPVPGASPAPTISVTTALNFGLQPVGVMSPTKVATVVNGGTAPLVVSSVTVTGPDTSSFALADACTNQPVAPGQACAIGVGFDPISIDMKSATILVSSNASPAASTVFLSGTGGAPVITVPTTTLGFTPQVIKTTSAPQVVTVTNDGSVPLTVQGATVTGSDFAATSTCTTVAPSVTCAITVMFAPTTVGTKTGTLTITSNDPTRPTVTVALSGTAVVPPTVGLTPSSLVFAAQNLGTAASAPQSLVLSNIAKGPVTVTGTSLGGDVSQFAVSVPATCMRTRAAGLAFCTITARFSPTVAGGAGTKVVTVTVTTTTGSVTTTLTGVGVAVATVSTPATLNLGRHPLNSTTTTTLTVTNTGSGPLTVFSAATTGSTAYLVDMGTCWSDVAPGATCQLVVTFQPTKAGNPITDTLTITSNATNATRTVKLTGRAP